MIIFLYPWMVLLLLLPFLVYFLLPKAKGLYGDALKVPFVDDLQKLEMQIRNRGRADSGIPLLRRSFWLLFLVWTFLTLAAMRPLYIGEPQRLSGQGRDILMVMDISTSMLETDYAYQNRRLDRLTAVKSVASEFIKRRAADRIGLILFGTRAYLQAPLTYDHHSVNEVLWSMDAGMAGNLTSIGDALGLALKSLKDNRQADNKVIVLLTDGENNDGRMSLPEAINLARQEGVKVYTIGVGGQAFSLAGAFFGIKNSPLDEKALKELAAETKGRYFRADDLQSLVNVYQAIDQLEPVDMEQNFIYPRQELYYIPLLAAFALAVLLAYGGRRRAL